MTGGWVRLAVGVGTALGAAWLPAVAEAQDSAVSRREMTQSMEDYFAGERTQALSFVTVGATGLGLGAYLWLQDEPRARGASYPVLITGLIGAIVGTPLLFRTEGQIADRRERIATDPAGYKADETKRMEGVMRFFDIFQYSEIGLILVGIGLSTYGAIDDRPTLEGVGAGIAASAAILLAMDHVAAGRGDSYLDRVRDFDASVSSQGFTLGYQSRF